MSTKKNENVDEDVDTYNNEYQSVKVNVDNVNKKIPIEMIKYVYIVILGI